MVSTSGVSAHLEKITAIGDWPTPRTIKGVQAFLQSVEFYRQYLWDFGTNVRLLNRLTAKGTEWIRDEEKEKQQAFIEMMEELTITLVLGYQDSEKPCILDMNAPAT